MPSNQCDKCGRSQYPEVIDTCKRCLLKRIDELVIRPLNTASGKEGGG